jgi:hypothetical protein
VGEKVVGAVVASTEGASVIVPEVDEGAPDGVLGMDPLGGSVMHFPVAGSTLETEPQNAVEKRHATSDVPDRTLAVLHTTLAGS